MCPIGTAPKATGTVPRATRQARRRRQWKCRIGGRCAYMPVIQKGIVMHISSALTQVEPARSWARKVLPGVILLIVLALLGALLPVVF
jgi:hypothetical protein